MAAQVFVETVDGFLCHVLTPDAPVLGKHRRTDVLAAALKLVIKAGDFEEFHPRQPQIGEQAVGGRVVGKL